MAYVVSRRHMMTSSAAALGGALLIRNLPPSAAAETPGGERPREGTAESTGDPHVNQRPLPPGEPGRDYTPVVTPNGVTLPWRVVDGVKDPACCGDRAYLDKRHFGVCCVVGREQRVHRVGHKSVWEAGKSEQGVLLPDDAARWEG